MSTWMFIFFKAQGHMHPLQLDVSLSLFLSHQLKVNTSFKFSHTTLNFDLRMLIFNLTTNLPKRNEPNFPSIYDLDIKDLVFLYIIFFNENKNVFDL